VANEWVHLQQENLEITLRVLRGDAVAGKDDGLVLHHLGWVADGDRGSALPDGSCAQPVIGQSLAAGAIRLDREEVRAALRAVRGEEQAVAGRGPRDVGIELRGVRHPFL